MKQAYDYKHNPIVKKIFIAMLAPTIFMNLTTAIGSMADTVIIGHYLDDLSLSVVTFATPLYMIINTFAALFAVGGCIAMGIDSGKGSKDTANKAFSTAIELLIIIGLILLLSGVFFIDTITGWLGAGDDVFDMVRIYSRIVLIGGPVFVLNVGLAFFVRNDGRPTLSMIGMFTSIIVDIILNVVFVGAMEMGVAGAALSTVLGQLVSVLVIATHFFTDKNTLRFRLCFDHTAFRIVKNGTSAALHFVYQFLTILIINHLLAKLAGTNGVVIYTVVFNLSTVSLALFEGISQTIQPMVSLYFGEKSYKKIKDTLRLAFLTIIIICGTVTVLLELAPQVIPMVFGIDDAVLIQSSATAVRIYATSMIIMTVNVVIGYYLQSTEQNFMAAVMVSMRSFVLFLGATLILGMLFGMNGIWAAYIAAEVLSFFVYLFMVQIKRRKLRHQGICTDVFLLDESVEKQTLCYTFDCSKDSFDTFWADVCGQLKEHPDVRTEVFSDAQRYLQQLKECNRRTKGTYIEVEVNGSEKKVIIRDNLNHGDSQKQMSSAIQNGSKSEYGPVLGWNRMCLE